MSPNTRVSPGLGRMFRPAAQAGLSFLVLGNGPRVAGSARAGFPPHNVSLAQCGACRN
jgi:hypothetical protein